MAKDFKGNDVGILQVRMSTSLKQAFKKYCEEDEIDMSDKIREFIAHSVRARQRETAQPTT